MRCWRLSKRAGSIGWLMSPHQTVSLVPGSLTMYLSFGERPVCRPVFTTKRRRVRAGPRPAAPHARRDRAAVRFQCTGPRWRMPCSSRPKRGVRRANGFSAWSKPSSIVARPAMPRDQSRLDPEFVSHGKPPLSCGQARRVAAKPPVSARKRHAVGRAAPAAASATSVALRPAGRAPVRRSRAAPSRRRARRSIPRGRSRSCASRLQRRLRRRAA